MRNAKTTTHKFSQMNFIYNKVVATNEHPYLSCIGCLHFLNIMRPLNSMAHLRNDVNLQFHFFHKEPDDALKNVAFNPMWVSFNPLYAGLSQENSQL